MANKKLNDTAAMQFLNKGSAKTDEHNTHSEHSVRVVHDACHANNTHGAYSRPEPKSRRLNLHIQPSVADRLNKIATMKRTSVNDLINTVLRNYTETEQEAINKYDETFL